LPVGHVEVTIGPRAETLQEFFKRQTRGVKTREREHPVMMNYRERHLQTRGELGSQADNEDHATHASKCGGAAVLMGERIFIGTPERK
jgi:hypothetical protein